MRTARRLILVLLLACHWAAAQAAPAKADVEARVNSILQQMTLEEKIDYIGGVQGFYVRAMPRLGLPALKMADGPLGVRNYGPSTAYPAGIALAASFDPALVRRVGEMVGKEARARGVHFMLSPGLNIYRAPMCGRNFEYYGEDPFLAARTAVAYIGGVQSQGVIATAKHFAANNSEFGRHNTSSDVDERTLREIYLPAFEAAVREAHVGALMDSYNLLNGTHATQNPHLNLEIAKQDWGFDGIIMSDWDATYDGVAAANAGLDLEMPFAKFMNRAALLPAIREGKITEATIDDKVRRILRKAIQFGFLDRPLTDRYNFPLYNVAGRQLALEAARAGMVLLKNNGKILPLDKSKIRTIAVIGPDAYPAVVGGGGSARVTPFTSVSYLEGLANYNPGATQVLYAPGTQDFESAVFSMRFVTAVSGGEPGLKGEYFNNQNLEGTPALTRTDRAIGFMWRNGYAPNAPAKNYSVRWTGYFTPPAAGEYRAWLWGDHAFRLFIDDKLVADRWDAGESTHEMSAVEPVTLGSGPHAVRLEAHFGGRSWLPLDNTPSIGLAIVPADQLIPADVRQIAASADVAIVFAGFNERTESESFDRTFRLPGAQDDLIKTVAAANKNTIVVLTSGGSVDMTRWIDAVPALVQAWYPGQEGGRAIAELLFGDFSPSGRLPASFEQRWEDNATYKSYYPQQDKKIAYTEGVFLGYRHFDRGAVKPLFPFGYGLSYTTFKYGNLAISPQTTKDGNVTVSFDVSNTGQREGAEVAQLYIGDHHAKVPRPVKELKGFAKVTLKPGETRRVSIAIDRRALSYYDPVRKQWVAEPGEFEALVARSAADVELRGTFRLE